MIAGKDELKMSDIALGILVKRKYQVWFDDETDLFYAKKDSWEFVADSPLSLLGLVTVYEIKKPETDKDYWWNDTGKLMPVPSFPKKRKYKQSID